MICVPNTDLSFSPFIQVDFFIPDNLDYGENIDIDNLSDSTACSSERECDMSSSEYSESEPNFESETEIKHDEFEGMKFITFFSSLLLLLKNCLVCGLPAVIEKVHAKGTALCVKLFCERGGHSSYWFSQPKVKDTFMGNILSVASVLFGGGTYIQFKSVFNILNLQFLSSTQFYFLQKRYVFPAINIIYKSHRNRLFQESQDDEKLDVSGDGRCDTPGYNAKYCTYSLMNQTNSKILHFHVVSVDQTTSSVAMEKCGLIKTLDMLECRGLNIHSITTDDHQSIKKYLKDKKSPRHQLDIWHKSKNIKKKITKLAKNKLNSELQTWSKSLINHFWWCCSTCNGNVHLLREKWISILSHVCDIHEFNDNKLFKKCSHGPIQPRAWLTPGSPAHNSLKSIVMDKRLLKDLSYFVDFKHTGNIEVYHSLLLKYCPKRLHFSPHGMIARTQLAVLHFNSIINAEQACTKDRTPRFKLLFSKVSQCYVVKPIRDVPEKAYLEELVNKTIRLVESGGQSELPRIPENETKKQKPSKEEVIKFQKTRFFVKSPHVS